MYLKYAFVVSVEATTYAPSIELLERDITYVGYASIVELLVLDILNC